MTDDKITGQQSILKQDNQFILKQSTCYDFFPYPKFNSWHTTPKRFTLVERSSKQANWQGALTILPCNEISPKCRQRIDPDPA